ncbi:MAG: hypothetical protein ACXVAG_07095 [Vulcanimicrobiaceae bacterium]
MSSFFCLRIHSARDRALKFDAPQRRLRIPNVGWLKLRKGRAIPAYKRAWLVCKRDRWYAQFECEREIVALAAAGAVGLDRGVAVLPATSNGDLIENPRHIDAARLHLERAQCIVAKRKRRGHVAAENRSGVRFACVTCSHVDHADVNAARVILKRAQREPLASCAAVADGDDPRTMLSPSGPRLTLHDAA